MGRTYTYRAYHPNRRRRQLQIGAVALTVSAGGLLPLLPHPAEPVQTPLFGQTTPLSEHSTLAPSKRGKGGSKKDKNDSGDPDSSGNASSLSDSSALATGRTTATVSSVGIAASLASSPSTQPSAEGAKSSGGLAMLAAPPTESAPAASTPIAGGSSAASGSAASESSLPVSAPAAAAPITDTAIDNGIGCQVVSADELSQALSSARPGQLLCLSTLSSGTLLPSAVASAPALPQVAPSTSSSAAGATSTGAAPTAPVPVTSGDGGGTWTMHIPFLSGCYTVPNTASAKSGPAPKQVRVCGSESDSGAKR